jgi:transposase
LQAAEWFAEGVTPPEVARRLRVSCNPAYVWRRRWRAGGVAALASRGPGGAVCRLSGAQPERLRAALEAGPAVRGRAGDQRRALERAAALTGRLFHVRYTLRGTSFLLHRMGFTPQVPVHRAAERDEDAIAAWRAVTWAKVRG